MYGTMQSLNTMLDDCGWQYEDFRRNQMLLGRYKPSNISKEDFSAYRNYWYCVYRLHKILSENNIQPVFLKSRRNYIFYDSNVDILISRKDWSKTIAILNRDQWRVPSLPIKIKQNLIERSKLKLQARTSTMVPAHLYGAVSWRYQSDIGFLPGKTEAEHFLELVPISDLCPGVADIPSVEIVMTTPAADLLIHSAQTVFENYQIFLGEVVFIKDLWSRLPEEELEAIIDLACRYGGDAAMELVHVHIENALTQPEAWNPKHWPQQLTYRGLARAWISRAKNVQERTSRIRGLEELMGYALFCLLYRLKRSVI